MKVVALVADGEHEFVIGYRNDPATYNEFDGELPHGPIVKALLVAVTRLARETPDALTDFAKTYWNSDLLIVHRLLSRGLVILAADRPMLILDYLLGDSRRLAIGDQADSHRESKALIAQLSSQLSEAELKPLEEAVINFNRYKRIMPEWSVENRRDRAIWTREHRLRLLRAFLPDRSSESLRAMREQEERALPGVNDLGVRGGSGWVGPRLTADELHKASDDDLLNLLNELPDETGSHNPKMLWSLDFERAGGAWQLARELGALAKQVPERVLGLLNLLSPGNQETYAGEALKGLADTNVPTTTLIACINSLNEKGFSSGLFREGAAESLKFRASREKGLPEKVLETLKAWLAMHPEPDLKKYKERQHDSGTEKGQEILFGHSSIWSAPHGRGPILEALAEGYLRQSPPNYVGWANVIESRIGLEKHPAIWVKTLTLMPTLFNWDRVRATALFDSVIRNSPSVLEYAFALRSIANIMRLPETRLTAQSWISMLRLRGSEFSQQAYGELLFLYLCAHNDTWSRTRLDKLLRNRSPKCTLLGLAHGASRLWKYANCRTHSKKVLLNLVSSNDRLIVQAVANLFRLVKDEIELDQPMRLLVSRLMKHRQAILESSEDLLDILTPVTAQEPKLLAQISNALLRFGRSKIKRYAWSTVPENLTNIALTLHRQEKFRAAGLKLFESLIEINLAQAKSALDVLDRNPIARSAPYKPTRLRRRRVVIQR